MNIIYNVGIIGMLILMDAAVIWFNVHAYKLNDWSAQMAAIIMALCIGLVNYITITLTLHPW